MALYGLRCHQQNIIWTEAKLSSIYYFVGDRPVHKLPFDPKCNELFAIVRRHVFVIVYLKPKKGSDKIRKKTLYGPGPVYIMLYGPSR
jgi:hypothetical protein